MCNRRTLLRKDLQLCCVAIVLFQLPYFASIEICLTFGLVTTTTENIAVLVRPHFYVF